MARPFTVADGIVMTRINNGQWWIDGSTTGGAFYPAPDGRRTLTVLRKGNLDDGHTEYELVSFETATIREHLARSTTGSALVPKLLCRFSTPAWAYGIDQVVWSSDSRTILFIGRGADGLGQVYRIDAETGELLQLTHHPKDIVSFELLPDGQRLFYSAFRGPEEWRERNSHGYALTKAYILNLAARDPNDELPRYVVHYILDLRSQQLIAVNAPPAYYPRRLSVSPSGRFAVISAPAMSYLSRWPDYAFIRSERVRENIGLGPRLAALDTQHAELYDLPPAHVEQFFLIDLSTGAARPLIDAPSWIMNSGESKALWSKDERRVLLAPTYLPLTGTSAGERDHRTRVRAVAEVDIRTGAARRVADVSNQLPSGETVLTVAVDQLADGSVEVLQRASGSGDSLLTRRFRERRGQWSEEHRPVSARARPAVGVELFVAQDLNTPPEIAARDVRSGRERILTDLNPQFRELTFGRVASFQWRDRLGRTHVGGLVTPPGFEAGQRHAVVLQTYGFAPDAFLMEGPPIGSKAVFAAQALANRGMIVVQMPHSSRAAPNEGASYENTGENPRFIAMLESAIDALDSAGLIDRSRVGLSGFSRTGMHVLSAVTFSNYPIAAATSADSVADTPFSYAFVFGLPGGMMADWEQPHMMGTPFWGHGIKQWLERSSAFHLDKIRTPLRLEQYGPYPDGRWDTYAILKRFRRPIELFRIPSAQNHILTEPYALRASQGGNVDWFDFWLQGHEDPDPAKLQQYERWRMLRGQHAAHLADMKAAEADIALEHGASSQP